MTALNRSYNDVSFDVEYIINVFYFILSPISQHSAWSEITSLNSLQCCNNIFSVNIYI